jgi:hypothetical protein
LGEELTKVLRQITKENPRLQGVIDIVDFNATISGGRIIDDGRLSKVFPCRFVYQVDSLFLRLFEFFKLPEVFILQYEVLWK